MSKKTEQCQGCRFWVVRDAYAEMDIPPGDREGKCHRYPPKIDLSEAAKWEESDSHSYLDYRYWNHPITMGEDWCGEFAAPKSENKTRK